MNDMKGAYSLVIDDPYKLMAARDPNGFRPLCIGELPDGSGWAFAGESCALDAVGANSCGTSSPVRSSSLTATVCAASRITAAPLPTQCACSSTSTLPARSSIIEGHLRP